MDPLPPNQDLEPADDQVLEQHLQAGTILENRYLIQEVVGVGGMGAVYRARDMHFPNVTKTVAVKEMINQALDPVVRSTIVRNFEREADLLASLDHRAIPRIYDYFSINERSYLVLEFINGEDLEAIINNSTGFIPEERVIRWAIELCDVLQYLHFHKPEPIIFRDMKPSNVMINQNDHAVLVDFGIAKRFQSGQRGTMIGTEGYSPPEQYRGEATPLADIYALGATLHHLLTRRDPRLEPPFSFGERPIRKINPGVSPELEAIITTALQYNVANRFPSAQAMKEALLKVAQQTGILNQVISPAQIRNTRFEENVQPVWAFRCQDEIRGTAAYASGTIYIGSYDQHLYALDAKSGALIWKYATDGGIVSRPAIHEDSIYFGSEDHRLHAISQKTGRVNWTFYTQAPVRSSPYIAEGHVFIGSDDGFLYAVNLFTGRHSWKTDCGGAIRSTPIVQNDLIYFGTEAGEFFCLDFSGAVKWKFRARRAITSSPAIARDVLFFGSLDSTLYALDAKTGWTIARFRLGKATISTPLIQEHLLYIGAVDGIIYCLEAGTFKEVWRFSTTNQVTGSPTFYKDAVYCGSVDGFLYCLDYRDGRLRWKYKTQGAITATPVVFDDIVYIGSTDHHLYAIPVLV